MDKILFAEPKKHIKEI